MEESPSETIRSMSAGALLPKREVLLAESEAPYWLLRLAQRILSDKANGVESEYAEMSSHVARHCADVVAEHGLEFARGWVEGWWYAAGNKDGGDATWRELRALLGMGEPG